MSGGKISGNTAIGFNNNNGVGGGVFIEYDSIFTKTGGTITGYNAATEPNGNVAKNTSGTILSNAGNAVFAESDVNYLRRETTAGPGVNLSYNGTVAPPTFSGGWDY
jgi:hypothetical protein